MKEVIGSLVDSGYSPQEVREMMGPLMEEADEDADLGSHIVDPSGRESVLHDILTQARDDRQPPGPQVVVPSGLIHSLPEAQNANAIRVDTEDSYRAWRGGGRIVPEDHVEALSTAAEDELMGAFDPERGYASQDIVGNIMNMEPASRTALFNNPNLSDDQSCVVCGVSGGDVVCDNCHDRLPELLGLFERGYASQWMVGFGERGAAASLYDDNPSATLGHQDNGDGDDDFYRLQRMVGGEDPDGFYRLPRHELDGGGRSPLVGADEFYRLPRHSLEAGGLSALIGDVLALAVPSTVYAEEVPLAFHNVRMNQHVTAWKQGAHIYGSIRVTGWDGQPRILTAATPYAREVGIVVGYSNHIAPTNTLAVLDPLARRLGASRLLPRLAAAAPPVLRISSDKLSPLIMTAMPAGR